MTVETPKAQEVMRFLTALEILKDAYQQVYEAKDEDLARVRAEALAKIDSVLGVEKPAADSPTTKFAWLSWYEDREDFTRKHIL